MNRELKKLVTFGIIIGLVTSSYVAFLGTGLRQGFFTDGFWLNWLILVPKSYAAVLPVILLTGPLVRKWVDRMFASQT